MKLAPIAKNILEIRRNVTYSLVPKTISIVKEEFIRSIPTNDYFTNEEKYALSLYFQTQTNFNNRSIRLFESQVNEDVASWFKTGWKKLKQVFGNIKDYVVKLWTKIKDAFINVIKKGYDWIQGQINSLKDKVSDKVQKVLTGPDKNAFLEEVKNLIDIQKFLKNKLQKPQDIVGAMDASVIDAAASKAAEDGNKVQENINGNIFTKEITEALINLNSLILESKNSPWMKWIGNIIKIVLNPIMGTIGVVGQWAGTQFLNKASKFIEKLGGPKAVDYHVTPEMVFAILEVTGLYEGAWEHVLEYVNEYVKVIPFLGQLIHFWEFGHKLLIVYACIEIIVQLYKSIQSGAVNLKTATK